MGKKKRPELVSLDFFRSPPGPPPSALPEDLNQFLEKRGLHCKRLIAFSSEPKVEALSLSLPLTLDLALSESLTLALFCYLTF